MEFLKRYFTKRYFLFFAIYYVLLYVGTFFLVNLYAVSPQMVFYVGLVLFVVLLTLLMSFLYFRKSINDWNDRFVVVFGWIILAMTISAFLIKPIYGQDWTTVVNWSAISSSWLTVLVLLSGSFLAKIRR